MTLEIKQPTGRAIKLYPPFKGPYLATMVDGQNAHCFFAVVGPIEVLHVSKLKRLKEQRGKMMTFVPDLSDTAGSSNSNVEMPCADPPVGRSAQGKNPSPKNDMCVDSGEMENVVTDSCQTEDMRDWAESPGFSLREEKGDPFQCPTNMTLFHCVSHDCWMGNGIAEEFRSRYPALKDLW